MNKKNTIIAAIAVAIVVLGSVLYLQKAPPNNANVIRIASNMPMSGELAFYGGEIRDGLLMAVADQGGKLPEGASISFDWGDNRFSPKDAATVLQRQLQQSPTIYTSALKPQVMAVEKEVAQVGIPHLAWVLDLTPNPSGTTNNFRTWVSFKLECDVFFAHAKARGAKNVVLCYVSLPSSEAAYGEYLAGRLRDELGCKVTIERYNPNVGADDFRNIAARVASNKPDLTMLNGFIPHMVGIVRGLRPLGVIGDGNTMAALDMLDAAGALSAEESEGILVAAPPFMINPDEKQKEWRTGFEKKFGRKPSYHAAFAYDGGLAIIDAASRLKLPASSQDWMKAILATDTAGITGSIRFDGDQSIITSLQPAIYRSGELVPLAP
jgi:ABC-type branched-subunit amino acid transport system substrate-binding protein